MSKLSNTITRRLEYNLKKKLGLNNRQMKDLSASIFKNEVLISGGSVLASCFKSSWDCQDFDFYVNTRNYVLFYTELKDILYETVHSNAMTNVVRTAGMAKLTKSEYSSFCRKNGIRKITEIISNQEKIIDIIHIRNKKNVLDVINNFDLTFCQTWYDGKNVYTSHPEMTLSKKGVVKSDYVISMMKGNKFTLSRIEKYNKRGFVITLSNMSEPKPEPPIKDKFKTLLLKGVFHQYFYTGNKLSFLNDFSESNVFGSDDGYDSEDYDSFDSFEDKNKLLGIITKMKDDLEPLIDNGCQCNFCNSYIAKKILDVIKINFTDEQLYEYIVKNKSGNMKNLTMKVYDDIMLEEHIANEFLIRNKDNIIVKSGEKYYAYYRHNLVSFMSSKNKGDYSELLTNQLVFHEDYHKIINKKFQIYLTEDTGETETINGVKRQIFLIRPVSIDKFKP